MRGRPKKQEVQMVPLPVYLPEDVHKDLRHAAIDEGRSATDIIRELVKVYLAKKRKRKGVK
jgi:plasmid stability protein